jgi:iron complex outermembrane receptor protein
MRFLFLLVWAIVLGISGFSQEVLNDTVYELPQVQISSERIDDFSTGLKIQKVDSLVLELNQDKNLGELLTRQSPLYIKSYGQGSLATISFRGTSSAHTGIFWNGFNLNLPNLGSSDLSLIPSSLFNSIEVLYGASGSLFGSGNIGGNIQLRNNPQFNTGTKANLNLSAGSYNSYGLNGTFQFSNDKWWTSTAFTYKNARNDFPFTNLNGDRETRDNAAVLQYGLIQYVYRKISNKHLIGLSFWYQFTDREIPNTLVTRPTKALQDDESIRVSGSWKYFLPKGTFVLKSAFLRDDENYSDPDSEIEQNRNSRILTNTFITEANYQYRVCDQFEFNTGANIANSVGEASAYINNPQRMKFGVFGSVLYRIPKINWKINLNLRQDFIESFDVPFTPSLGFEGKIWKFLFVKANFSKNFRVPTFNDLYWEPYGNSELQPETSYNGEVGLSLVNKNKGGTLSSVFSGTVYSSIIDNWILWVPVNNNWSPENIQKVWSRGLELEEKLDFRIKKSKFTIALGYALVKSTNQEKISENDQSFEKQLIYVPEHSFSGNVDYLLRSFIISFNTSLTGKRYVTRDNEGYLPAFVISDLRIVKKFSIKKNTINVGFEINNLWGSEYQAIQYYPMPGRNYKLSLNFKM